MSDGSESQKPLPGIWSSAITSSPLFDLQASERKVCSQNGEDGVIEAIFRTIGVSNRFFVEFGCEDGSECNTTHLVAQGWQGVWMDDYHTSNNPLMTIHNEVITAENIDALFRKYQVPQSFDLLSIDIDGNDFWVWRQIVHRPRVVVIEYNPHFPPPACCTIRYDPEFQFKGTRYFGASLVALEKLGRLKGYTLVHCERAGANAFFLADEVVPPGFVKRSIEKIYRRPNYFYKNMGFPVDPTQTMIDPFAYLSAHFQIDVG
jgi:hypothetical protein